MLKQKIFVTMLALSFSLTAVSVYNIYVNDSGIVEASAATDDASYASQFSNITLAKSYKDLTQANPCMTHRFSADPGVMEYNGRVYVYTTNDEYIYDGSGNVTDNTYGKIQTISCMSSSDMVNWTDHGKINVAGSNGAAKWAGCSWAPTAAHKTINGKEKFFLYFANNACGIGVLTSDSPTGPWTDPIGKPLISSSTPNCSNVTWLFDPAVLVDDDGTGYLYFGGGVPKGQSSNPKTARVVKLGDDMTSLAGTPTTIDAPYMFEDSGINKIGNTYYYSYCTNWSGRASSSDPGIAQIAYMTSSSPMGPFTYQSTILDNPGKFFGCTGNNHHTITKFKDKWYIFYHAQWLENKMGTNKGYRSTHVDSINVNNGKFTSATGTLKGVAQVENLNPYVSNRMSTIAWQGGVNVYGTGNTTVAMNRGDWTGLSNVDFGTGAGSITMKAASVTGAVIKVCTDSPSGTAVGYISIPATGSLNSYKTVTADISNLTGTKKLFFVASGDCSIDSWQFAKSGSTVTPTPDTGSSVTTPGETVKLQDGWYYIKNINAQKYLQVTGNTGKATANIELGTGTGVAGQKWYLKNVADGYVTLQSALGNYMVDIASAKNEDGANVQIYNAYSGNAQKFMLKSAGTNGACIIATKCSNLTKVLDDYNGQKADGTNVCQWSYNGNTNQQWVFESTTNNSTSSGSTAADTNTTASNKLDLDYTINNWGSEYQVVFKITNNSDSDINTWKLKIKKSDINIASNWNVNVAEDGDYYVITPMDYNASIAKGNSVDFGIQGKGSIGSTINYTLS